MPRPALWIFAAIVVAGAVALAAVGAARGDDRAFTIGVVPWQPVVGVGPGSQACQTPIDVSEPFTDVTFIPSFEGPPPAVRVVVRDAAGDREIAASPPMREYASVTTVRARVGSVPRGERVAVCVDNVDRRRGLELVGNAERAARRSEVRVDGQPVGADLTLTFHTAEDRSLLSRLPRIIAHAELFKGWVGAWTLWAALAAVLLAVPLLLARALAAASRDRP